MHDERDAGLSARFQNFDTVGAILGQHDVRLSSTEGCLVSVIHFPEFSVAPQHPNQSQECGTRTGAVENRLAVERRNAEVPADDANDAGETFIMCADERRDRRE